jgi:hypothetical protein
LTIAAAGQRTAPPEELMRKLGDYTLGVVIVLVHLLLISWQERKALSG